VAQKDRSFRRNIRVAQKNRSCRPHFRSAQRNGGRPPPSLGPSERGLSLAAWLQTQERRDLCGALSAVRRARLAALGGWRRPAAAVEWERHFNLLLEFKMREGHAAVPRAYVEWVAADGDVADGDGGAEATGEAAPPRARVALGEWLHAQRTAHGRGKLGAPLRRRLDFVIGIDWRCVVPHRDDDDDDEDDEVARSSSAAHAVRTLMASLPELERRVEAEQAFAPREHLAFRRDNRRQSLPPTSC